MHILVNVRIVMLILVLNVLRDMLCGRKVQRMLMRMDKMLRKCVILHVLLRLISHKIV